MRVEEYQALKGRSIFGEWFETLDTQTALIINTVLTRMMHGNNSNIKSVGSGVYERTIDHGPGYRIYFGKEEQEIIVLLCGGSKKRQQRDIDRAKLLWKTYRDRKKS
jgi:putative addiction module killer protein